MKNKISKNRFLFFVLNKNLIHSQNRHRQQLEKNGSNRKIEVNFFLTKI